MVSEDFPEPDTPVTTTSLFRGMATETFCRLCTRAPLMRMASEALLRLGFRRFTGALAEPLAGGTGGFFGSEGHKDLRAGQRKAILMFYNRLSRGIRPEGNPASSNCIAHIR